MQVEQLAHQQTQKVKRREEQRKLIRVGAEGGEEEVRSQIYPLPSPSCDVFSQKKKENGDVHNFSQNQTAFSRLDRHCVELSRLLHHRRLFNVGEGVDNTPLLLLHLLLAIRGRVGEGSRMLEMCF